MEKKVRRVKKGEDESNLESWRTLSGKERLAHLEELRQEVVKAKYGHSQGLQRVIKIIKRS